LIRKKSASFLSASADDTIALGKRLGRCLRRGDAVLLFAPLGGGKTTFTQGVLQGLGGRELAPSPTFVMAQTFAGRAPLHHMDFYRLSARELLAKGVQDYFTGEGAIAPGVIVVEWPERCRALWPKERMDVKIALRRAASDRKIDFVAHGPRYQKMLSVILKSPRRLKDLLAFKGKRSFKTPAASG
jgi:tRNA threonylcarbamoyladenosine biosynthesis protein TsaE